MTEYKIEKNIPMPRRAHGAMALHPLGQGLTAMEPGDSIYAPLRDADDTPPLLQSRVHSHITRVKQEFPARTYAIRRVPGGVRVWRTA